MSKKILLVEAAPKITAKGDLFHIDYGIEGLPVLAYTPAVLLAGLARAGEVYDRWSRESGAAVRKL